jgi:mannose-6-phosphate isomerase-like protein (cupin superfamily)
MEQHLTVVGREDEEQVSLGGFGIVFRLNGSDTAGGFALVEHPLAPHTLAGPLHTHEREDEFTYVLEGEVGLEVGGHVSVARPGDVVVKPRGVAHAFWNAGDRAARVLELIAPAGFEDYFRELGTIVTPGQAPDVQRIAALCRRYGLTMDFDSVARLCRQHGLRFG